MAEQQLEDETQATEGESTSQPAKGGLTRWTVTFLHGHVEDTQEVEDDEDEKVTWDRFRQSVRNGHAFFDLGNRAFQIGTIQSIGPSTDVGFPFAGDDEDDLDESEDDEAEEVEEPELPPMPMKRGKLPPGVKRS